MRRVYRRRRIAAAAVVGIVLLVPTTVLGVVARPAAAGATTRSRMYTVRPGDTLWSIAAGVVHGGDPRQYVALLESEVGGDEIAPGEEIKLPPG